MKKLLFIGVTVIAATLMLSACDKGPGQKQGEKVDNTYQQAKANVKSAVNKGPAEKAGEKIDQATDND
jgi:protein involved in sex pheromone biosynthesis